MKVYERSLIHSEVLLKKEVVRRRERLVQKSFEEGGCKETRKIGSEVP